MEDWKKILIKIFPTIKRFFERPYYVCIGTFKAETLHVDILVNRKFRSYIFGRPPLEAFLDQVWLGRPYCPKCKRDLKMWRAGWMANYLQIGYKCEYCHTEYEGNDRKIRRDVCGEIRKKYSTYWANYKKATRFLRLFPLFG